MTARERILTIRLLERLGRYPTLAAELGIECTQESLCSCSSEEPP